MAQDIFGAKFCIALGAWKLRFVLMLEDEEAAPPVSPAQRAPHHVNVHQSNNAHAR